MANKAWVCNRCDDIGGHKFEAPEPICPKCKADGRTNPGRQFVLARVVMHFDPPSGFDGVGKNYIACNPKQEIRGNKHKLHATGEWPLVSCPACKQTQEYADAQKTVEDLSSVVPELKTLPK